VASRRAAAAAAKRRERNHRLPLDRQQVQRAAVLARDQVEPLRGGAVLAADEVVDAVAWGEMRERYGEMWGRYGEAVDAVPGA